MKTRTYQLCLLASITLTGMAVLIIEITATRILTPFFGNSIFTFSSVISTILAALSLGYYLGGRVADRQPSERLFYALIALSGFAVLLLQILQVTLLPRLAYRLSMIDGPLVMALLLFFVPALFLGMLSPFAIKLLHRARGTDEVGTAAGLVFFWSTLGSIVGSLGAGFVLIPSFGVSHIVIAVGIGLLLLGGAGLLISAWPRAATGGVMLVGLALGIALLQADTPAADGVLYFTDGLYEKIVVREIPYQGRTARILMQDRNINSGMFTDDGRMAFDYTRYFDLYRLFTPRLRRALAIGGGAYSVPTAILRDQPDAVIDVAEIEPRLLAIAQRYFELPDDPRLNNHIVDGRRFLHDNPQRRYDLIFLDVYRSFASVPMQFATAEFFQLARARLADDGVFIANYYASLSPDLKPLLDSLYKTMRGVFAQVYLIATIDPASEELQNFIFIGHDPRAGERIDLRLAAKVEFAYPQLRQAGALEIKPDRLALEAAILLSDDFAPVEYYAAQVVRRYDARLLAAP